MTTETAAAQARRMVREHREAEAKYHATLPPSQTERMWAWDADHLGYTHTRCGQQFGPFVDPQQTTEHAVDHDKTCEVPR